MTATHATLPLAEVERVLEREKRPTRPCICGGDLRMPVNRYACELWRRRECDCPCHPENRNRR